MVTIGVDKCVVVVVGATVGAVAIGGSVTGKNVDTFGDSGPYVYNACDGGPVEAVADAGIRMWCDCAGFVWNGKLFVVPMVSK